MSQLFERLPFGRSDAPHVLLTGRGNFAISAKETTSSGFFVMVHRYPSKGDLKLQGITEHVVEDIPLKNPLLATMKSTNYLINALVCQAAEDKVIACTL